MVAAGRGPPHHTHHPMRVLRGGRGGFVLRWTFVVTSVMLAILLQSQQTVADQDDFAEFDMDEDEFEFAKDFNDKEEIIADDEHEEEEEEDDEEPPDSSSSGGQRVVEEDLDDESEATVEDETFDDEEFENINDESAGAATGNTKGSAPIMDDAPLNLKFAKVPAHLINNWENYYLELLMVAGLVVYFINFLTGKTKNYRIAHTWFRTHKDLLQSNFSLVGDDGAQKIEDIETQLMKEGEHLFSLWCSGRVGCEGMLVEMRLLKRQDLVAVISNLMKPAHDQVQVKVQMNTDEMDTFVFCLAHKRTANKLAKEMHDLNTFCPERRPAEKYGVPAHFFIMSEIAEVSVAMMDPKMVAILNKYPNSVDSIHFSDQFTGPKPGDDQVPVELPSGKKVLIFTFNVAAGMKSGQSLDEAIEDMKPLMLLVFYFMDKIKRYKLSREAKNKAEKHRSKVAEAFWKSLHASRAERAQEEREKKRRDLKEKIKNMDDPEKQRKLEERENRRDKKKNAPKMKQLKIKAM